MANKLYISVKLVDRCMKCGTGDSSGSGNVYKSRYMGYVGSIFGEDIYEHTGITVDEGDGAVVGRCCDEPNVQQVLTLTRQAKIEIGAEHNYSGRFEFISRATLAEFARDAVDVDNVDMRPY